ncbi:MAG: NYN domain-containing protein [Candidatus Shapirobacteria bacterium]|nr:NYN domain-containing protein [Candidatus Shapirobacteria bacterium]
MKSNTLTYAFIDSQNLNLGTQLNGWKLDFGKFRTYLLNKFKVKKTYLFIGYIEGNSSLYHYLQEVGYILIFKHVLEVKKDDKTTVKGNVDAELVLHAMIEYPHYNQAIIVSGDGDFYCLVEYLEKNHKLAKVIVPNQKYSSLLRKYASHIFPLNIAKEKLQIKKEKERHSRGK